MKKVLLIDVGKIKELSPIESNVDERLLNKTILLTQTVSLRPILGINLYNNLVDAVEAYLTDDTGIPASLEALLEEYVQPYLIHQVLVDFMIANNYKMTNKGLLKLRDENADAISINELEQVKDRFENITSTFKVSLIDYLDKNNLRDREGSEVLDNNITNSGAGWYLKRR